MADLAAAHLVAPHKSAVRISSVRLTTDGEARARALCGLPDLDGARRVMEAVRRLGGEAWETWLADIEWGDTQDRETRQTLVELEERALPALLRGWLASASTMQGHVHYTLTEAGAETLTRSAGDWPEDRPGARVEARAIYYTRIKSELRRFDTATPGRAGEIGMMPLPLCRAGYGALEHRPAVEDAQTREERET